MAKHVEREPMMAGVRVVSSDYALKEIDIDNTRTLNPAHTRRAMEQLFEALAEHRCDVRALSIIDPCLPDCAWAAIGQFAATSRHLDRVSVTCDLASLSSVVVLLKTRLARSHQRYTIVLTAESSTEQATLSLTRV